MALGRGSTTVPSTSITSSLATLQVSPVVSTLRRGRTQQRASDPGKPQYRSRSARMSRNRSAGALPGPFRGRSPTVLFDVRATWETGPDAHRERDRGHHPCRAGLFADADRRLRADLARSEPDRDAEPDPGSDRDPDAHPHGLAEPE